MRTSLRSSLALGFYALALSLAGCGGGGNNDDSNDGINPFRGTSCGTYKSNASDNGNLTVTIGDDGTFNGTIQSLAGFSDGTVQGTLSNSGTFDGTVSENGSNESRAYVGTLRRTGSGITGTLRAKDDSDLPSVEFSLGACTQG